MQVGSGSHIQSYGVGNVVICPLVDGKSKLIVLPDVIFAPKMKFNLISKSGVRRAGYAIVTEGNETHTLQGVTRNLHKQSGRTVLVFENNPEGLNFARLTVVEASTARRSDLELWHRRLCHVSKPALAESSGAARSLPNTLRNEAIDFCEWCKLSKSTIKPLMA